MLALCTCSVCASAGDGAYRWRVADLASAFLQSNQLIFRCQHSQQDVNLKKLVPPLLPSSFLSHTNARIIWAVTHTRCILGSPFMHSSYASPFVCSVAPDITLVLSMTLEYSNLKVGKEIGRGSYSRVYDGVYVP